MERPTRIQNAMGADTKDIVMVSGPEGGPTPLSQDTALGTVSIAQ